MNIRIRSRYTIQHIRPVEPFIIISITTEEQEHLDFLNIFSNQDTQTTIDNFQSVLYLKFDDASSITTAKTIGRDQYLFNFEHAKQIIDFVKQHEDQIDLIYCHCDAGISRSSAVAAALSVIYNGNRSDSWIFNSKQYAPNALVYRRILNEYYK